MRDCIRDWQRKAQLNSGRVIPHSGGKVSEVILSRMKIKQKKKLPLGDLIFDFFREGKFRMNKANSPVDRIKIGLGIALLAALTGCVGYVDGGYVSGGYGGAVVVAEPDVYLFGGGYERGRDVHGYSDRGSASRAVAHPSSGGQGSRPAPSRPATSSPAHSGSGGQGGKR